MTRAIKTFEVTVDEDEAPIEFDLVFNKTRGGYETHSFQAMANPGAGGQFAASALVRYDDKNRQVVDMNALMSYFDRVLLNDSTRRFRDLCDRKDLTIPLETLAEVYQYLLEEQSGRPTTPSSQSAPGRQETGESSTAPLSSVV